MSMQLLRPTSNTVSIIADFTYAAATLGCAALFTAVASYDHGDGLNLKPVHITMAIACAGVGSLHLVSAVKKIWKRTHD